ncbi:MAG: AsnC family protein [Terracidiphilus sp.]|jgi:DNA invertase Pin-like site-specific DNA recombinase
MTDTATRQEVRRIIADYIRRNPTLSYAEIAKRISCSPSTVWKIAKEHSISRMPRIDVNNLHALDS